PALEAAAYAPGHHFDERRGEDRYLEEHAFAPRGRPAETEPRAADAARRGVSSAARRAGGRAGGWRPADSLQAAHPQWSAGLPAHAAVQRARRLEGRDPTRTGAQPSHS